MKVYLCIGAPGSGKSVWSKKFVEDDPGTMRVCPDEFRAIFGFGEGDQTVSARAFFATYDALGNYLRTGKDVVVDATNMYPKTRKKFLQIARGHGALTTAVVFEMDKATLLERNKKRGEEGGRNVPENVIDDMLSKYQPPFPNEFDEVIFISMIKNNEEKI